MKKIHKTRCLKHGFVIYAVLLSFQNLEAESSFEEQAQSYKSEMAEAFKILKGLKQFNDKNASGELPRETLNSMINNEFNIERVRNDFVWLRSRLNPARSIEVEFRNYSTRPPLYFAIIGDNHEPEESRTIVNVFNTELKLTMSRIRQRRGLFGIEKVFDANGSVIKTNYDNNKIMPLNEIYGSCTNLSNARVDEIFQTASRTNRVVVTVLDSIDYNHMDLAYKIPRPNSEKLAEAEKEFESERIKHKYLEPNENLRQKLTAASIGYDFLNGDHLPYDDHIPSLTTDRISDGGHGTQVAGILANAMEDIAILPVEFRGSRHDGYDSYNKFKLVLEYAYSRGSRIILMAWGYDHRFGGSANPDKLEQILRHYSDVLFIVSSGNESLNLDVISDLPSTLHLPNVLSVASVNSEGHLSSFSNWGQESVNIAASGENIQSCAPGGRHENCSGTSFAAPAVARVAAKIKFIKPNLTPEKLIEIIEASSSKKSDLRDKLKSGGILNEDAAVELVRKQ